ncbi:hypothetical protein R3P38DRAFT_3065783 [Favolaschia claudopus]|uniref:Uncharacterized protein n=1 Tax=Favolaschia claudopus TaxID=2862362 RepID=A0AAW0A151_9AGAR
MVLAQTILEQILAHTSLKENLQFHEVVRFLDFTRRIWVEVVPPEENPPLELPANVARLLAAVLNLEHATVQLMWVAFRDPRVYHGKPQ